MINEAQINKFGARVPSESSHLSGLAAKSSAALLQKRFIATADAPEAYTTPEFEAFMLEMAEKAVRFYEENPDLFKDQ